MPAPESRPRPQAAVPEAPLAAAALRQRVRDAPKDQVSMLEVSVRTAAGRCDRFAIHLLPRWSLADALAVAADEWASGSGRSDGGAVSGGVDAGGRHGAATGAAKATGGASCEPAAWSLRVVPSLFEDDPLFGARPAASIPMSELPDPLHLLAVREEREGAEVAR